MLQGLKPVYNAILSPAARVLKWSGIGPDLITFMGLILFGAAGFLTYKGVWMIGAMCALAGALMDGLDGLVARINGGGSLFGGILDSVSDRVTEIFWLMGFLSYYYVTRPEEILTMALIIISGFLSLMISYVKARAEGSGIKCSTGLFQRPERIILLLILQLCGPNIFSYGIAAFSVLALFTVLQRIFNVWKRTRA